MKRWIYILVLLTSWLISTHVFSQDWVSPVRHPIKLSGTFCELRTNHFHHGIDIRSSKGVSGDDIRSIGDGKIHRLRVQAAGYGYSVYIRHPEGYVSVYGHLLKYSPKLDSIVKHYQYQREQFEIDIYCDSMNIPVHQSEVIGQMGSSGYSFGPHLHFEIRDADTETTINPLLFGFDFEDKRPPTFTQLRLDFLSNDGRKYTDQIYSMKGGKPVSNDPNIKRGDTLYAGTWRCGLALRTQDVMNQSRNRNGVYQISVQVDSQTVYQFKADSVGFDVSRGSNLVRDLETYYTNKERWYLAYSQPGSPLPITLLSSENLGWIKTYLNQPRFVEISISDFNGNAQQTSFFLLRHPEMIEQTHPKFNYHFLYDEPNIIRTDGIELSCPQGAFYRNEYVSFDRLSDKTENYLSDVISIKGSEKPFHQPCTLRYFGHALDSTQLHQTTLVQCNESKLSNFGGESVGDTVVAFIREFGDYVFYQDRIPPQLEVIRFPSVIGNGEMIKLKIADQIVSKGTAREVRYRATIDGHWIPLAHDVKSDTFTFVLDDLHPGPHLFKIEYEDHVGNKANWQREFSVK